MKKLVVAVLLLIVLGLAAAPYWFGMQAEKVYEARLGALSKEGVAVSDTSYHRGWLSSTAKATLLYPGVPVTFVTTHEISHGPLPFAHWLKGDFAMTPTMALIHSNVVAQLAVEKLPAFTLPPIDATTQVGFDGVANTTWQIAAGRRTLPQGFEASWQTVSGTARTSADGLRGRSTFKTPEIRLKLGAVGGTIKGIDVNTDTRRAANGLPLSDSVVHIEHVTAPLVDIDGFQLNTGANEGPGTIDVSVDYRVRAIKVVTASYGPAELKLNFRRLDTDALLKFNRAMSAAYRKKLPPEQMNMVMMGHVMQALAAMGKRNPEIEIKRLGFTTPDGDVEAQGGFTLDGRNVDLGQNPMLIATALSGGVTAHIPVALAQHWTEGVVQKEIMALRESGKLTAAEREKLTPEKVAAIATQVAPARLKSVEQRLNIAREGDTLVLKLAYDDGHLSLNGQPMPQAMTAAQTPAPVPAAPTKKQRARRPAHAISRKH